MTFQEAIGVLKELIYERVKVIDLEKELGIPKNNLSGFLSGTRNTPQKWQDVIIAYAKRVEIVRKPEPKILLPPKKKEPEQQAAAVAKKEAKPMPTGLTKPQQLRWHRENSQTLK